MKAYPNHYRRSSARRSFTPGSPRTSGMTLLELTVVILVLLSLITILFVGARAWKRGSDRAICIINIQSVQKGVRGFSNIHGYDPGATVTGLKNEIVGIGRFVESTPSCPGGGTYSFGATSGVDTIPQLGELYLECTLSVPYEHEPTNYSDW